MLGWFSRNKRLLAFLLITGWLLVMASPILAYVYSAAFTVKNTSTTNAYTSLPVSVSINNTFLASNGFISTSGNDTRVQTAGGLSKPRMVASDRLLAVTDVPVISQTNLFYTTGNSATSSMPIITGYGGYVSIGDNAAIEPGINFTAAYSGYVDVTTSSNRYLIDKTSGNLSAGLQVFPAATSNITAQIITSSNGTATTDNATTPSGSDPLYTAYSTKAGEYITGFLGTITQVDFYLKSTGVVSGNATVSVRRVDDNSVIGTLGTIDTANLTGGFLPYSFNSANVTVSSISSIRVLVEWSGGDAGNNISVQESAPTTGLGIFTDLSAGGGTSYAQDPTHNSLHNLYYVPATLSVAREVSASVTSADHIINVIEDGANFWMTVDGVPTSTVSAVSVPDNAFNYVIMRGNSSPYLNYFKLTVGGVEKIKYQPNTMIIGTALPNLDSGGSYPGVITWGSNPAGVTVTLGSMVSSGQPNIGSPAESPTTDTLPTAPASDWFKTPDIGGSLATNPFRPFVRILSDTTSLTERQAWTWLGIGLVLAVVVGVGSRVKGHHLITGVATGVVVGLLVQQTVFPFYALTFMVIAIIGGVIAERKRFM